jgi:hypothetical protein
MGFRKRKQQPQASHEESAIQRASKDAKKAAEREAANAPAVEPEPETEAEPEPEPKKKRAR